MAALNLVLFLLFSGLYMSRGIQLQLLDPLEQAGDRLARKIQDGEVLGLAIARELCALLEVEVKLEHSGPEGTLFSLHPPVIK